MASELSGRQFGRQAAWRIGLFVVLMFGVPLALYVIDTVDNSDVTLTEAMRLTTATPIGLLLVILLALSLSRPSWRRMRSLGLPGYLGLFVPVLLLADFPYFVAGKSEAMFGSSISSFGGRIPLYVLMALSAATAMIVARRPMSRPDFPHGFGAVGACALVLAVLTLARVVFLMAMARWTSIVIPTLGPEDAPSWLYIQLTRHSYWPYAASPYLCVLFIVMILWCAVSSRRQNEVLKE